MKKITGTVIHGDGYGTVLGYPTANLDTSFDLIELTPGVYAAKTVYNNIEYCSSLVIDKNRKKIEINLFDFSGDLYGQQLFVEPIKKIGELVFVSTEKELKKVISTHTQAIKDYFSQCNN